MKIWSYQNRANRTEFFASFFLHYLLNNVIEYVFTANFEVFSTTHIIQDWPIPGKVFTVIISGIITLFSFHFTIVRRLHDLNKPGRYAWTLLLPIINLIYYFRLFFSRGDLTANQFGSPSSSTIQFENRQF
jgi:uncharacterized membrane protein YhaH (DUF805 family)